MSQWHGAGGLPPPPRFAHAGVHKEARLRRRASLFLPIGDPGRWWRGDASATLYVIGTLPTIVVWPSWTMKYVTEDPTTGSSPGGQLTVTDSGPKVMLPPFG